MQKKKNATATTTTYVPVDVLADKPRVMDHIYADAIISGGAIRQNTINRILDVFPANQQQQVKIQLAQILKGIVCQQLVPGVDGGLIPVFEVMKSTVAVQNMIRESKLHQLESVMQAGSADGMCTMDVSLLNLYKEGKITKDTALLSCVNYENMVKRLG